MAIRELSSISFLFLLDVCFGFESDHQQTPTCDCQPSAFNQQAGNAHNQKTSYGQSEGNSRPENGQGYSNQGGYQREKTTYEKWAEQEARAEAERRRRAEEAQEAALKEALERARQTAEAAAAATKTFASRQQPLTEEQLRWRISLVLAAIFVFLLIGGFNKRYEPSSRPNSEFSLSAQLARF